MCIHNAHVNLQLFPCFMFLKTNLQFRAKLQHTNKKKTVCRTKKVGGQYIMLRKYEWSQLVSFITFSFAAAIDGNSCPTSMLHRRAGSEWNASFFFFQMHSCFNFHFLNKNDFLVTFYTLRWPTQWSHLKIHKITKQKTATVLSLQEWKFLKRQILTS